MTLEPNMWVVFGQGVDSVMMLTDSSARKNEDWRLMRKDTTLDRGMCVKVDCVPCADNFAYVLIISQPSSHASPGGCGGAENSYVLKISTTKNEALSTICCYLRYHGPHFTN